MAWFGLMGLALRVPAEIVSGAVVAATLATLLVSILVIVYRRGRTQAFALGYLIFCGGALRGIEMAESVLGSGMGQYSTLLHHAFEWLFLQMHQPIGPPDSQEFAFDVAHFEAICSCAVGMVLGVLGGGLAQMLYATRPRD
jgi:hypothetical protein